MWPRRHAIARTIGGIVRAAGGIVREAYRCIAASVSATGMSPCGAVLSDPPRTIYMRRASPRAVPRRAVTRLFSSPSPVRF
jgi:hypothetical protein